MSDFLLPVDIANRGLQHVGEKRIAAFTDSSKNASEVNFCYDKLRKAELQRNIWRFAIREAILRPVGATTMKITFAAYDATKTYLVGSCVTSGGILYMANAAVPLATVPGSGNPWVQYFGPLSVSSWGANTNGVNPPNWVNSTTYAAGANVLGSDGNTYKSIANGNINNNPVGDNGVNWTANGTPNKTSYFAGELVYYPTVAPTVVYLSLVSGNTLNPSAVPAFDATITYNNMNTATFGPTIFQSSEDLNLGNTPVPLWLVGTTYAITNQVLASDNNLYSSVAGGNIGFNPVGDLGVHWTLVGAAPWVLPPANQVDQMMGQNWLRLTKASVVSIQIIYPGKLRAGRADRHEEHLPPAQRLSEACALGPEAGKLQFPRDP